MDVKNLTLIDNRAGVSVTAYSNGGDKSVDRIRGNWFSAFNNNITRKSTNSNGYGVGVTGREIADSIKRFGGAWIGDSRVAYEDRVVAPPPPPTPAPPPPSNNPTTSTQENCYSYPNYFAIPADIKSAIYNQFKDDNFNFDITKLIELENSKGIEYVRRYDSGRSNSKSWTALGQVDVCIRRRYLNTPSGSTLMGTEITKLIYIITRNSTEYRHGGGDGSNYNIDYEWTFRMDGIAKTRTELSSRTSHS